jgi:DNA gyrase subunit B
VTELGAQQLGITTLGHGHRRLRRTALDDAEAAAAAFDLFMGDNPARRKDFIFAEDGRVNPSCRDV